MPHSTDRVPFLHVLVAILGDLRGLFLIQGLLLSFTFLLTQADAGDVRVQLAWLVFLVPGWCLSASWTGSSSSLPVRYTHSVISAIGLHSVLSGLGSLLYLGFAGYFVAFSLVAVCLCLLRGRCLPEIGTKQPLRLPKLECLVWIAIMILVVSVYREPRSADIIQFSLQQQDMAAERSLQPSSIGMQAMGVEEAMPRWRAHLWHLAPSLIAYATSLPVDGVLRRWAPIPVAFSTLVVLVVIVRRLAGRRVPLWAVAIAVFGPVILWYRSYNAFNYSFRLTNNFCLDKDLCLFLLIPAAIYVGIRWIRDVPRSFVPMVLLIPAILKYHPMTAVYLVLLIPFVVIGYDRAKVRVDPTDSRFPWYFWSRLRANRLPSRRAGYWIVLTIVLFVAVVLIGDAQTAHEQIAEVLRIDWQDHRVGRPLHYWVGHYAAIPDHDLHLDTIAWVNDRLTLRARVIMNCELLGAMNLAWWVLLVGSNRFAGLAAQRRFAAITLVLIMLWGMWWVAPSFLTWRPHYLAGYERLHWFAYLPALVAVSSAVTVLARLLSTTMAARGRFFAQNPDRCRTAVSQFGTIAVVAVIVYGALCFRFQRETLLTKIRGFNSLLDFELPAQIQREQSYDARLIGRDIEFARPEYLGEEDRVLFLDNSGNDQYWLIRQGLFWSEPYAEAYALRIRGDVFLEDRRYFYKLLDRQPVADLSRWLERKHVNLLVDRRPGADDYLAALNEQQGLGLQQVAAGVWRRTQPTD